MKTSEKERATKRRWREKNPGYTDAYYAANPDKLIIAREQSNDWHRANKERDIPRRKSAAYKKQQQRARATAEYKAKRRAYRKQEVIRKKEREYQKSRRDANPAIRLEQNIRTRVWTVLRGRSKAAKTLELLGCSSQELRIYLEKSFKPGMSWDSYGLHGWVIDHKKPCAKFDLSDPAQQRECFHYTNLQPLWAIENWKKGARHVL